MDVNVKEPCRVNTTRMDQEYVNKYIDGGGFNGDVDVRLYISRPVHHTF